jgi:hypothetical protein
VDRAVVRLVLDDPAELDGFAAASAAARAAASESPPDGLAMDGAAPEGWLATVEACPACIFSNPSFRFVAGRSPARASPFDADF